MAVCVAKAVFMHRRWEFDFVTSQIDIVLRFKGKFSCSLFKPIIKGQLSAFYFKN